MISGHIAILIPHYNNLSGLIRSIESISYPGSFEIYIVDDGSNDNHLPTHDKLNGKKNVHSNELHILYLEQNSGIEHALNHGLKIIRDEDKSEFVARLDCGDLCINNRLEKQSEYLRSNTQIGLVGSWATITDGKGKVLYQLRVPINHVEILKKMYITPCFVHPSVMFRTKIIDQIGYYPTKYKAAEDYAYFFKIAKSLLVANLPHFLIEKAYDDTSITYQQRRLQLFSRLRIMWKNRRLSVLSMYGLTRTMLILLTPRVFIEKIKRITF